jgi:nitroreductase
MSRITASDVLVALRFRYATKLFDPARKIDPATWSALEESLILTPSSFGLQPWKFIVITDTELRESLVPHSWNQRQVADCSHLVVMAVRRSMDLPYLQMHIARVSEVRGVPAASLAGYLKMLTGSAEAMNADWAAKQAYIALGQFMLAAALLGIDTCPMEGFVAEKYDEVLGLQERGLTTAVLCPAGYRATGDRYAESPKVRWSAADVIEHR